MKPEPQGLPTVVVHGIWDSPERMQPLVLGLLERGLPSVHAVRLWPNDGSATLETLGLQCQQQLEAFAREGGHAQIDLVGFSMGALVSRWMLHNTRAKTRVRRFVSVSGPHHGTLGAFALPLAGVRQMRRGSAFLAALEAQPEGLQGVEVSCLYTPYDLMIVPARSAVLPEAQHVEVVQVGMHRWMITAPKALDAIARCLCRGPGR